MVAARPDLAEEAVALLRADSYAVDVASTLEEALRWWPDAAYDGLVIDRAAPDGDGLVLAEEVRRFGNTVPILVLDQGADADARLHGLRVGVDAYLTLSVSPEELALRVRRLMTRTAGARPAAVEAPEVVGRLTLYRSLREVHLDGVPVPLSATQYCLAEYMITHRHRDVMVRELLDTCWDREMPSDTGALPPQLTRVREAFQGAMVLVVVARHTYRVLIEGDDGPGGTDRPDRFDRPDDLMW